jgi:hypothetical protein
MAARSVALTGGDFTLVRDFQPINWHIGRTPRRLVRHLVDDLTTSKGIQFSAKPVSMPELDQTRLNNTFPRA